MPLRFWIVAAIAVEVVATLLVASQIGVLATFLWFLVSFVLGLLVIRMAGKNAFAALREATDTTTPSGVPTAGATAKAGSVAGDSVLLFVAGVLLAVPGVLTDVAGVLLLIPPLRTVPRHWIARSAGRRFPNVRSTFTTVRLADGTIVVPGEVVDEGEWNPDDDPDDPRRQLPPA
jgi:UPF0716 protein FxsA